MMKIEPRMLKSYLSIVIQLINYGIPAPKRPKRYSLMILVRPMRPRNWQNLREAPKTAGKLPVFLKV